MPADEVLEFSTAESASTSTKLRRHFSLLYFAFKRRNLLRKPRTRWVTCVRFAQAAEVKISATAMIAIGFVHSSVRKLLRRRHFFDRKPKKTLNFFLLQCQRKTKVKEEGVGTFAFNYFIHLARNRGVKVEEKIERAVKHEKSKYSK